MQCLPQVSLRKCNRMPHYQLTSLSPAFFWWTIENNIVLICQCFATYFNSWRQFFWPHFWEFLSPSQTPAFFSYSVLHWNLVGSPNDMNLDAPQPISSRSVEEPDHCTMYMNRISKLVNSLCKPFVLDLCNFGSFQLCLLFGFFYHLIDCIVTTAYRKSHCTIAKILPSQVKLFRRYFSNINSECNKNI